ncbi:beta-galactosidase [Sediminicola sp. YIK13]|uniref:glycoside hydrolase family 2 TIM barrel-domain containing protein n=1 Tax=Sediminicola sp. YIK13 TaxID=1453352 RepID=UPI00071F8966|nr:glycoside hydrolase family 2 TIM barrel-domain containing protein [Sediminicola sp. YIK13]ALM07688.1 beta-galactosidase [Sediminicola sp. YIK13]
MKQLLYILSICLFLSCKNDPKKTESESTIGDEPAKVQVSKSGDKFQLLVNGEPFYIKGAGLEFGNVAALAEHNANSFRTWRTDNGRKSAVEVLDEAHEHGLMVSMGIEVERERHGFDYDDEDAVQKQKERIKKEVLEIKDHPALLIWVIGNELNLNYTNPKVWDAVNDISKMIHELDPNHPTTTTLAGIAQKEINYIKERCGDLDILSVQMYGDLPDVPKLIREYGWNGPYMVTEWGATGHWEVPTTDWGAPIEENSTLKASNYLKRYKGGIAADTLQCIGSYVFLWGNKQERTPTWYGIFLENGMETESVGVMHYIWNGKWPDNRTPQIASFVLDGKTAYNSITLEKGKEYIAQVIIKDIENDPIAYRWEILPESEEVKEGGDHEARPESVTIEGMEEKNGTLKFKSPAPGNYRLFVYADDGHNHQGTANIPFQVN